MSLTLTAADLRRIERAQHTLLSPLDFPHVDQWRLAVNRQLREVLRADSAGFLLPVVDGPAMLSEEHDPQSLAPFPELLPPPLPDGTPIWARMLELGVCNLQTGYGEGVGDYLASAYFHEYAAPNGACDTLAAAFSLGRLHPSGAASLHFWHDRQDGPRRFGQREIAILRLLFPAFRAGVEMYLRTAGRGGELLDALDGLGEAVLACDREGGVALETMALREALHADPEGELLRDELRRAALEVWDGPDSDARPPVREVRTRLGRYQVQSCRFGEASGGKPLALASLQRLTPRLRTPDELRREFGLTAAEARVALLLAQGRSNAQVSAALGISPFTARRHTERVLQKLGAHSRAEVGARLYF